MKEKHEMMARLTKMGTALDSVILRFMILNNRVRDDLSKLMEDLENLEDAFDELRDAMRGEG